MIKIINVYETPPPEDSEISKLHVDLEIDGYPWTIGGLPADWTKQELLDYLQDNEADMLRQAKLKPPKEKPYPRYRYELGNPLPHSEHVGKLISVNPSQLKPAVVRRKFEGELYDVNCLVTQSVAELFQAGKIQVNDYVLVSFIEEMPDETEKNIAIITDKVYKSW